MDSQVRFVKMNLEGWATVLLKIQPVLAWEQAWHPLALVGVISTFYLMLYCLDLNALTLFAVLGFIVNLLDFTVPFILKSVYGPNFWTGQMEKKFEDICHSIVDNYNKLSNFIQKINEVRIKNPIVYYASSCCILLFLVHLSSTVNNTLLFYILTIAVCLWPGIRDKGLIYVYPKFVKVE